MERDDKLTNDLLQAINNASFYNRDRSSVDIQFELTAHPFLLADLRGWIGAFTVRAILYELNVDESHIFNWRPENKYIQYLIFNHYSPKCMPHTLSLTNLLKKDDWVEKLRKLIKYGYFIKATLGFGSGTKGNFDRTSEFEQILKDYKEESFSLEKWIVQKKLKLKKEWRIHTFGKDVIYGATLTINGVINVIDDFDEPQVFIQRLLKRLPPSLIEGTLIGWDVALTKNGTYYVIEANFTGFHPILNPGFQTTGYVDQPPFGPIICAWLNTYFRVKFAVSIVSVETILLDKFQFMDEFAYYLSIFKNEHMNAIVQAQGRVTAAYIYLTETTDFYIVNLVSYLQIANFADTFYIISNKILRSMAEKMFKGVNLIHLDESSLFTRQQYEMLMKLDDDCKKEEIYKILSDLQAGHSHIVIV